MSIPVICDRCRATGSTGKGDFTHLGDLLDFTPVPRKKQRVDGWNVERQRAFIAALSATGSKRRAARSIGMAEFGVDQLLKSEHSDSFKAAYDRALAIAARNGTMKIAAGVADAAARNAQLTPPSRLRGAPLPGQILNERGEWEDKASIERRAEDARDSIKGKLLRIRRFYLQEISDCPGKRAAFEILTELPIDWDIAERGEPQPDEPCKSPNQRQPEMILLAESGWSWGEIGYGPDRKAEARRAMDEHRAKQGLPPIRWDAEEEDENEHDASCETTPHDLPSSRHPGLDPGPSLSGLPIEGEVPSDDQAELNAPANPAPRTLSLNSPEFHQAVTERSEAWIPNGALPRAPRERDPEPVVKKGRRPGRRTAK